MTVPSPEPDLALSIPLRLLSQATPLGIGLYGLVARLYVANRFAPVPLSDADIMRYDPSLSRGAVKHTADRLAALGWLIKTKQHGKSHYEPTWGMVGAAVRPWQTGRINLDRPRHLAVLWLPARLYDICLGRLEPNAPAKAHITRYVTNPLLTLADIGAYALARDGRPHEPSPGLQQLQLLDATGAARPVWPEATILALASQRMLYAGGTATLSERGLRRLGLSAPQTGDVVVGPQPLLFLPKALIGHLIGQVIDQVIEPASERKVPFTASLSAETPEHPSAQSITWTHKVQEGINKPPTQVRDISGGGTKQKNAKVPKQAAPTVPDTEATRLLRSVGVRPAALIRHAETSCNQIAAAIADAEARNYVNDTAAWVVSLLDDAKQHGHTIASPRGIMPKQWYETGGWEPAVVSTASEASPPDAHNERPGQPFGECAVSLVELEPIDNLTEHMRAELRRRVQGQAARAAISKLVLHEHADAITVQAAHRDHVALINNTLLKHITALLQACGRVQPVRVALAAPTLPVVQSKADDGRPAWVGPAQWQALPGMLRAALRGATLCDGIVRCVSPHLDALVRTRYGEALAQLGVASAA